MTGGLLMPDLDRDALRHWLACEDVGPTTRGVVMPDPDPTPMLQAAYASAAFLQRHGYGYIEVVPVARQAGPCISCGAQDWRLKARGYVCHYCDSTRPQ